MTSDIERHELWKMGHKKKNGDYGSEIVREVVEKIVSFIFSYVAHFSPFVLDFANHFSIGYETRMRF